jgi:transketolase
MENKALAGIASQVRRDIVRMVSAVNSGHPGGSLGCTDFLTYLYFEQMQHNANDFQMDGKNEDLFFYQMAIFHQFGTAFLPEQAIFLFPN